MAHQVSRREDFFQSPLHTLSCKGRMATLTGHFILDQWTHRFVSEMNGAAPKAPTQSRRRCGLPHPEERCQLQGEEGRAKPDLGAPCWVLQTKHTAASQPQWEHWELCGLLMSHAVLR